MAHDSEAREDVDVEEREEDERDDEQSEDEQSDDEQSDGGNGGIASSLVGELKDAIREAAMDVLGPAARQATTSAAKYAVKKGPELVGDKVMPAVASGGGAGGIAKTVASKAGQAVSKLGGKGGGSGQASGWGRNRRMPVQQWVYVSVPVRQAYNGWTQYKQWPEYMHRTNQVNPEIGEDKVSLRVTEKMWGFTRPFTAEVISQRPDEHIRWQSREGTKHTGTINFHELGPRLTLVEVNLDHSPSGLIEKTARGMRFVKRAVRADLHRFQGWIEMKSDKELDELQGWRGTVEDGKVTESHDDALEREQSESEDGARGQGEEGDDAQQDDDRTDATAEEEESGGDWDEEDDRDEPSAEEDEEYEAEDDDAAEEDSDADEDTGDEDAEAEWDGDEADEEEEEEEEPEPPKRAPARRRAAQQTRRPRARARNGSKSDDEPTPRRRGRSQTRSQ